MKQKYVFLQIDEKTCKSIHPGTVVTGKELLEYYRRGELRIPPFYSMGSGFLDLRTGQLLRLREKMEEDPDINLSVVRLSYNKGVFKVDTITSHTWGDPTVVHSERIRIHRNYKRIMALMSRPAFATEYYSDPSVFKGQWTRKYCTLRQDITNLLPQRWFVEDNRPGVWNEDWNKYWSISLGVVWHKDNTGRKKPADKIRQYMQYMDPCTSSEALELLTQCIREERELPFLSEFRSYESCRDVVLRYAPHYMQELVVASFMS